MVDGKILFSNKIQIFNAFVYEKMTGNMKWSRKSLWKRNIKFLENLNPEKTWQQW